MINYLLGSKCSEMFELFNMSKFSLSAEQASLFVPPAGKRYILIYYLGYNLILPLGVGVHQHKDETQEGKKCEKRVEKEWDQPPTPPPTQAIDALIGDEEKNGKQKRKREWAPNPDKLDQLVTSCNPHGSYSRPIL